VTVAAEPLSIETLRGWIGRASPVRPLELITTSDVRRYVDATGDANPLWLDDDFARQHGYPGRLLPPTLVGWVPFSIKEGTGHGQSGSTDLKFQVPLPPEYTNVRNAGTESEWLQPVRLGEQLYVQNVLLDVSIHEGKGKAGRGVRVTEEERVTRAQDELVFLRRSTVIIYPARAAA
jgi:acyl dehydratase